MADRVRTTAPPSTLSPELLLLMIHRVAAAHYEEAHNINVEDLPHEEAATAGPKVPNRRWISPNAKQSSI